MISGRTQVAGILGGIKQVKLSLSPAIHNAAFKDRGLDWVYVAFGTAEEGLGKAVRGLAEAGVGGMNVTMPHKVMAMKYMDELTLQAGAIGALNTIELSDGKLVGHNTDGVGLVRYIQQDLGVNLTGSRVLVIGSGGSARAAVAGMSAAGADLIRVLARDVGKAEWLHQVAGEVNFETAALGDVPEEWVPDSTVIINATPLGQKREDPAISTEAISEHAVVVDLVYRPPVTPLVEAARAKGAVAHSGLGMLLHQAALAFEIWTGTEAPMDAMSAAALSEMTKAES
ncbi:MAG: shikimate dehydrogenase [Actinomycetota bacterium]